MENSINENEVEADNFLFSTYDDGSYFRIAFDDLFEHEKLAVYNDFDLTSKRNFKNLAKEIKNTYETLFAPDGKFNDDATVVLLKILNSQVKIIKTPEMQLSDFYKIIDDICDSADGLLLNMIHEYIEANYSLNLNEITAQMKAKKRNVNDELFISDDAAKVLLEISYLSRVLIPVISQYFLYNKSSFPAKQVEDPIIDLEESEDELVFDDANFSIFKYVFDKIAGENADNLRNKLYKMAYARVIKTAKKAGRYWTMASNLGITVETETLEIYKKLLTNSMTKLICDKNLNIISFFSAVINKQTEFLFQNKFKHHYQLIDYNRDMISDGDDMSEFEKIEIRAARKDEGTLVLQKLAINNVLDHLPEIFDVPITMDEVYAMLPKIHKNTIQEKLISVIMLKYFDDTTAIKHLDALQYSKVLLCCAKYLEKHKFVLLNQILLSKCEKHRERIAITGTQINQRIHSTKLYEDLFKNKYSYFKEQIDKQLSAIIATVYCSIFKDENDNELFDSTIKVGNIAEELVGLAYLI